jgi:LacI family transcriptional regulator
LFPLSYVAQNLPHRQSIDAFVYDDSDGQFLQIVADWLQRTRPEVAVGTSVGYAIDLLGWRVPQDIALITFDHSPLYASHAGLDQRYEETGRLAADVLIGNLRNNRRGIPATPVEHMIKGEWVDGPSAPRVTRRSPPADPRP